MSQDLIVEIFRGAMKIAILIMSPVLLATMMVGLAVSIFQAATQIHEITLTFVPKILIVAICLLVLFPWMINHMVAYTTNLFSNLSVYVK